MLNIMRTFHCLFTKVSLFSYFFLCMCFVLDFQARRVGGGGGGGSRGSNEPPKIFEDGIFGELKR